MKLILLKWCKSVFYLALTLFKNSLSILIKQEYAMLLLYNKKSHIK